MFCREYQNKIKQLEERLEKSEGLSKAIDKSQAIIEFDLQGNILHANEIF